MDPVYTALVVGAGSLAHALIGVMFVLRVRAPARAHAWGLAGTAMALPLLGASWRAYQAELGIWPTVLPLGFVVFAVIEVVVDEVIETEIRNTRWLGPYLAAFYLGSWSLVGAAFIAWPAGGFIVLTSYFWCLGATAWSYRRVGHGTALQRPS